MADILRQNSELRKDRIWNYSIPAWYVHLPSGERFMTCPNAGPCAQFCYARAGAYRFSNVLRAHTANLTRYLDDREEWMEALTQELRKPRFNLHGFGMKTLGLRKIHHLMQSADSMAWSYSARMGQIRLPQCSHKAQKCGDCLEFATQWRENLLESLSHTTPQLSLFAGAS